jgi:hypothetical protein
MTSGRGPEPRATFNIPEMIVGLPEASTFRNCSSEIVKV